jgi:V8-like Glu-specific endopeptidase
MQSCHPSHKVTAAFFNGGSPTAGAQRCRTPMRLTALALLAAAMSLSGGVPTHAQTHAEATGGAKLITVTEYADNLDKVIDRQKATRFQGIGMIRRERELAEDANAIAKSFHAAPKAGHATGVNIGPCLVLTAYHVAFGDITDERSVDKHTNYKMQYNVGYSANTEFASTSELIPVVRGNPNHADFVLTKDANCSGSRFGWYELSGISSADLVKAHEIVMVISFSGRHGSDKLTVSMGNVTGIDPVTGCLTYSASTSQGSSGGAVFIIAETGELMLQGIHIAGGSWDEEVPTYSAAQANKFLNIADVSDRQDFSQLLIADLKSHPGNNPLKSYFQVRH